MITIGIDDTDIIDTRGTNSVARDLVERLELAGRGARIVRHQLLDDPRVPYTSKNGSASIRIERADASDIEWLARETKKWMLEWFIEGSDPGLCIVESVPGEVAEFGLRCKRDLVKQTEARELAAKHSIHLEGLGGTNDGVIGALAAVGLASTGDDGRIVHVGGWPWPDDLAKKVVDVKAVLARGIDEVRVAATGEALTSGTVDIVKNLRPNVREKGRIVLFVERVDDGTADWRALRPT
jgi:hypothetical protein